MNSFIITLCEKIVVILYKILNVTTFFPTISSLILSKLDKRRPPAGSSIIPSF